MEITSVKVLGAGCSSCHTMTKNARQAVKDMGLSVEVEYMTDMMKIMSYGIMTFPVLVINEKVVSAGMVLKTADIEKMLERIMADKEKPKVAFVCVHNSCRSQIAEALGKKIAPDVFESYSAGIEPKEEINPDAVRMMKKMHGIDMEKTQKCKVISEIPKPDIVVFMGCNVKCPVMPGQETENWGLQDPTGQGDDTFKMTIRKIEKKIIRLKSRLITE